LEREPFFIASVQVVGLTEKGRSAGWIADTTVTTIFYLLEKELSGNKAKQHVRNLLRIFHISNINRVVLEDALDSDFSDYKEGVLYQSAIHANLEVIVSRNQQDFAKCDLPVYSPIEFLDTMDIFE